MFTEIDEGKGLVKTNWANVRERVMAVEPTFARMVDMLNPSSKHFPLYLCYFPYGALKGNTKNIFLPKINGGLYSLTEKEAPKEIMLHLGYGKESSPLGIVIDKSFELFITLKKGMTVPWSIYRPGSIFPLTRVLNQKNNRIYAPNGVLSVTSGARSVFMLPNIGCATQHINLVRDFKVKISPPKQLSDHWTVFKEVIDSNVIETTPWKSCLIYFAESWIKKLHSDRAWLPLKSYLQDLAWKRFEYEQNRIYYDIACSIAQEKYNLKPNPYIADTARHLYAIALGNAPGYAPAYNDEALPLTTLQTVYVNSYGMKKYFPTIMHPVSYKFEQDKDPVYYSLQHPSTFIFSPKSRRISSTLLEMRELQHVENKFTKEFANDDGMCSNTIINKVAKIVEFSYFHNKEDKTHILIPSANIIATDKRFCYLNPDIPKTKETKFASDAHFVRGCIRIKTVPPCNHQPTD